MLAHVGSFMGKTHNLVLTGEICMCTFSSSTHFTHTHTHTHVLAHTIPTPTAIISCTAHTMCIYVHTSGRAYSPQAQTESSTNTSSALPSTHVLMEHTDGTSIYKNGTHSTAKW